MLLRKIGLNGTKVKLSGNVKKHYLYISHSFLAL